jgi:ketosteroid isomerase-like protein
LTQDGRLTELARRAYATLTNEGADAWDDPVPDFVWDLTPIGLGRYEGLPAFRDFFRDWVSSYDDWFMELLGADELSDSVIVISARQGGRMRGSEQSVDFRLAQVGVWDGDRLLSVTNYLELDAARAAAAELV